MANTIAKLEAKLPDGNVMTYVDTDEQHIKKAVFSAILDAHPKQLTVFLAGGERFSVDLINGRLDAAGETHEPIIAGVLKPIYYKHMLGQIGAQDMYHGQFMEYFVIGWQQVGTSIKCGLKVFPDENRYEVTENI